MVVPISIIGFLTYYFLSWLLLKARIDDPVGAFPIHFGCGFWGLLAAGFFQDETLSGVSSYGTQMKNQFVGAVIIASWTMSLSFVGLSVLHLLFRGLRHLDAEAEFRRDAGVQSAQKGPRGIVTLLFTGIQNCTILYEADEDCMEEAHALHDQVFRAALKNHHGFEVKTEEDIFMIAFSSAVNCAKFCIEVQRQLMETKWPKALYANKAGCIEDDGAGNIIWKGLRVRMGFHTGEPSAQENPLTQRTDYFGKDVNYASRMSSVGCGGQIMLSSASVKELLPLCEDATPFEEEEPFGLSIDEPCVLPSLECSLEYLGRRPLKGITSAHPDGEHVYQLRPFGLESRKFATAGAAVVTETVGSLLGSYSPRRYSPRLNAAPTPRSSCSEIQCSPRSRRARNYPTGMARSPAAASPANVTARQQAWSPDKESQSLQSPEMPPFNQPPLPPV
eukprot:GGOE01034219.1.p1 GENE.GGOE01034219.1~~GGOE01034219.1.p1  ORF type:complete len:447 (+),score=117.77 GGOE01034219.1:268-1608(+)